MSNKVPQKYEWVLSAFFIASLPIIAIACLAIVWIFVGIIWLAALIINIITIMIGSFVIIPVEWLFFFAEGILVVLGPIIVGYFTQAHFVNWLNNIYLLIIVFIASGVVQKGLNMSKKANNDNFKQNNNIESYVNDGSDVPFENMRLMKLIELPSYNVHQVEHTKIIIQQTQNEPETVAILVKIPYDFRNLGILDKEKRSIMDIAKEEGITGEIIYTSNCLYMDLQGSDIGIEKIINHVAQGGKTRFSEMEYMVNDVDKSLNTLSRVIV